jgi:DegV family protein with EDD domain
MGLGFQVLAAARAARDGADIEEAIRIVEQMKANTGVIFAVPNLDHLRKGGRIGLAQALLGSALSMVQVLEIDNGPISPLEQVRTRSKAISRIVDIVEQRLQGAHPRRIAVLHSDAEDAAWQINQLAQARLDPDEQLMLEVSQILAIHVGPGAFGMAYSTGA